MPLYMTSLAGKRKANPSHIQRSARRFGAAQANTFRARQAPMRRPQNRPSLHRQCIVEHRTGKNDETDLACQTRGR